MYLNSVQGPLAVTFKITGGDGSVGVGGTDVDVGVTVLVGGGVGVGVIGTETLRPPKKTNPPPHSIAKGAEILTIKETFGFRNTFLTCAGERAEMMEKGTISEINITASTTRKTIFRVSVHHNACGHSGTV